MSSNLSTVIQSITNTSRLVRTLLGHPSLHHGKSAKNHEMETNGNYHQDWREDLLVFIIVGKRGKMQRKAQPLLSFRGPLAPYYLGKVRHSLANGAMEKGASASALSSTSG